MMIGSDGEPVEPVGQIDGIGSAHDHERGDRQEEPAEMDQQFLEERHRQAVIQRGRREFHDGASGDQADDDLGSQLQPAGQALGVAPGELQEIVAETDSAVADGDKQHHPDKTVAQIRPE